MLAVNHTNAVDFKLYADVLIACTMDNIHVMWIMVNNMALAPDEKGALTTPPWDRIQSHGLFTWRTSSPVGVCLSCSTCRRVVRREGHRPYQCGDDDKTLHDMIICSIGRCLSLPKVERTATRQTDYMADMVVI